MFKLLWGWSKYQADSAKTPWRQRRRRVQSFLRALAFLFEVVLSLRNLPFCCLLNLSPSPVTHFRLSKGKTTHFRNLFRVRSIDHIPE